MSTQEQLGVYPGLSPDLIVSLEARPLLTEFRARVLGIIGMVARNELVSAIESSSVFAWSHPGEIDSTELVLSIVARAERNELGRVFKAILAKIAEEATDWSDEEREDYSKRIYFELEPSD